MKNTMRRRTFLQQLRDLVAGQNSPAAPDRERSRNYTKAGPGRMPYQRRTPGKSRFAAAHGPGSIDYREPCDEQPAEG